ncbi:hypothetical protein H2198_001654 [Neophaeococcomyces mojaviensis]|uniref:Uncharacterized protein n=1 Tax=Neophaeococcomyces mojaviensis TaxID=3383035 RepID=A0ACC3AG87_9EURO|nr:hypothetical protein H2198_001654 [Knufia sp. JES_112]
MANFFTADYSSSTASTPIVRSKTRNYYNNGTPELASTTPLAPPPSKVFGSSQLGTSVSKLRYAQNARDLPSDDQGAGRTAGSGTQGNTFGLSTDSYDEDMDEDEISEDEDYTQQSQDFGFHNMGTANVPSLMKFSTVNQPQQQLTQSRHRSSIRMPQYSTLPSKGNDSYVPGLARDLRKRYPPATLDNDSDAMILQTEQILRSLQEDFEDADDNMFEARLASSAKELEQLWEGTTTQRRKRTDEDLAIGPGHGATEFENARFVAILILRLYNGKRIGQEGDQEYAIYLPEILLNWLNDYHNTLHYSYGRVKAAQPNVLSDEFFWDVIEGLVARAKHEEAMELLADADFSYAKKDTGMRLQDANYSGIQLQSIQKAVLKLRQVLNIGPIVQSSDFDMNGPDWVAYRTEVEQALAELGEMIDPYEDDELLEAEAEDNFAVMHPSRKGLPYEIYSRLKTVYGILLGITNDVVTISNDWLEAAILLTIWWNGEPENKVQQWSFDVSRAHRADQDDNLGDRSYLHRLKESFLAITDPSSTDSLQLNPTSRIELGIASVLQGDMLSALTLIQTYSLCVAAAVAEMGSLSGWSSSKTIPQGFDADDLMVLTMGANESPISKDETLERYAEELFKTSELGTSPNSMVEGWEIAISVASRCDDKQLAKRLVTQFLDELTITTAERASRLSALCGELGFSEESRHVSEQFGNYLVNTTTDYGTALMCYARSRSEGKVRQVIDLLNSYCLVQSRAYPAEQEMDLALSRLVSANNPKAALQGFANADPEAVEVLQFYLVGYACVRRYYTIRDSTSSNKKAAARALVAAINSAADSIYGGLYDPERQTAIQVDGLLTLLGEATALIAEQNGGKRIFTSDQLYAILAAIEDLQTVSDRVYAATEECFAAALRQYHGSAPPSPHAMLKKSMSSGTNSNFSFSMMGSEMLARSEESLGGKSLGSAVLVGGSREKESDDVQRGWDWRSHFKGQNTTGADVLRYLRLNVAQELSMANLEEGV